MLSNGLPWLPAIVIKPNTVAIAQNKHHLTAVLLTKLSLPTSLPPIDDPVLFQQTFHTY